MKININGQILNETDAKISVLDHGLLVGDGIFETLRTINSKIFKFDEHYERLCNSGKEISLPIPISKENLKTEIEKTIEANNLSEARIRVTITRGVGPLGLSINCQNQSVIIFTTELVPKNFKEGIDLITFQLERNLPTVKSLSYLPSVVAYNEAAKQNCMEAILIDKNNLATEGSFSNIFIIKNNKIHTAKDKILSGITRDLVMELIRKEGIELIEENFTKEDLENCDEAFITCTTGGIIPVNKIDNKPVPSKTTTLKLLEKYNEFISSL